MAESGDAQVEKAFQKQNNVFIGSKRSLGKKSNASRFSKDIGLGFKTPKTATEGTYIDKNCPFTSSVSIRGRILKGVCLSTRMRRTIIIRRDYLHFISKFRRFEKRHKNVAAHCSPAFRVKEGDVLTVGQCRTLAKTVRFNVVNVEESRNEISPGQIKKQFRMF
jgi:small subunit ribosomal protein S11e